MNDVVKERVDDRRGQQREQQRQTLTTEDDARGGVVVGGADALGSHHGDHASDEGERGHEDGAQTLFVGEQDGIKAVHSFGSELVGVVDLQDAVLFHHAEEHEDAEHGEEVDRLSEKDEREDGEWQRERQREQDGEGMHPALKLRGEDEIHEDEGHEEGDHECLARLRHFLGASGGAAGVIGGQAQFFHRRCDCFDDRGLADAWGVVGGDGDLAAAIEAVDLRGAVALFQGEQIGDGHGTGLGGRHGEQIEDLACVAVILLGLKVDVILLAAIVVSGHVKAADEQSQRGGDVGHARAHLPGLVAVHRAGDFRFAGDERTSRDRGCRESL